MNENLTMTDSLPDSPDPILDHPSAEATDSKPESEELISAEIASALAQNPEALASVTSAFTRLEEAKPLIEVAEAFQSWQSSLMNPSTREEAIKEMLAEIEQTTGINPLSFGAAPGQSDLEDLKAWRQRQDSDQAEQKWIEANGPKILKAISTETGGWEVTPKMLLEARKQFPTLRNGLELVKRAFPDEFAEHQVRTKTGDKPRPPHLDDHFLTSGHAFNPNSHNLIGEYVRANGG